MSSKFITNQEKLLSDVMNNIIPSVEKFYCLVGYFYFSGFMELAEELKYKKIQILIGMEIERKLGKVIKEADLIKQDKNKIASNKDLKQKYYSSLVDLFGHTDICEGNNGRKAFEIFLKKIKDGSLEIKKTKESNHAKLYIFEKKKEFSDGGETPGIVITGSSNLTISGLKNRFEINVKSNEADDFEMSKKLFKELWDKSVVIASKDNIKEFTKEVVEKIWLDKLPKPYLVYIRVLYELFNIPDMKIKLPSEITGKHFFDLEYQKDAINKGLDIIEKHSGVIIADVVGLGKSIIASAIAYNLNLQTIIICPPHLKEQWEEYKRVFNFKADVYSSGSIYKALKDYENIDGGKLIIVDEAHKYRNELTRDYDDLKKLCSDNKVLLLTATPFNNKPQDIFAMISLFQIPAKSTIRTVDNLANRFKELIIEYKKIRNTREEEKKTEIKRIADKIRDVIFPVVVRRSRIDLENNRRYKKDLEKQGIAFSKVKQPKLLKYELGEMEEKYINTLDKIINEKKGFIGARYKPTNYIKDEKKEKVIKTLLWNAQFENKKIAYFNFKEPYNALAKVSNKSDFSNLLGGRESNP
ncbi:helicase, partial [Candidatus Parcubacteria bacterium]|nr:helicase [Candidatus Parcubacteria bacterium]